MSLSPSFTHPLAAALGIREQRSNAHSDGLSSPECDSLSDRSACP